jgi:predicted HicB family RNase H-like nuclease
MGKKRRGRPTKKASDRQAVTITVRVSKADRRAFGAAAKKSGQKLSDWIRTSLLAAKSSDKINVPSEGGGVEPNPRQSDGP